MILAIILAQFWCVTVCGGAHGSDSSIVNGYPWFAGLMTREFQPRCSGTIVTKNHVLTASACLLTRETNGSWAALEPNLFVIFIPSEIVNQVRRTRFFATHPLCLVRPAFYVGLVGFHPSLKFESNLSPILPFWSGNRSLLHDVMNYVLENAEAFTCSVVGWKETSYQELQRLERRVIPAYVLKVVLLKLCSEEFCISNICKRNSSSCSERIKGLLCAKIIHPPGAHIGDTFRGAGLACTRFLWGVLIGGTSSDSKFFILTKIELLIDFVESEVKRSNALPALSLAVPQFTTLLPVITIGCLLLLNLVLSRNKLWR